MTVDLRIFLQASSLYISMSLTVNENEQSKEIIFPSKGMKSTLGSP